MGQRSQPNIFFSIADHSLEKNSTTTHAYQTWIEKLWNADGLQVSSVIFYVAWLSKALCYQFIIWGDKSGENMFLQKAIFYNASKEKDVH